jgi:fermentation-respiration switch protein FrsA (DUF1100 family)
MFFRVSSEAGRIPAGGRSLPSIRAGRICAVHWAHRLVRVFLVVSQMLTFGYISLSIIIATQVAYTQPKPIIRTPAALGLSFQDVTFPSREDHVLLRGWFIPGVFSDGQMTVQRTIIMVHGMHSNRAAEELGLLDLSAALAHHGFAILAFDMRGHGESSPAPLSAGYFEQRDVLGAVDFLRSGSLPYPELGRPRVIGGWGVSMGGATMLLAAAREPAIRAVVADCAYAAIVPLLGRGSGVPLVFIPSVLASFRILYGVDYYAVRPVDVVARIAPRPIFFIQGTVDTVVPPWNILDLAAAASRAHGAHVQTWLVPGAQHVQSYHVMGLAYVKRVVAFFTAVLGSDTPITR